MHKNDGANGNRKMERRGLTLLELVVALAIVVATASVVTIVMMARIDTMVKGDQVRRGASPIVPAQRSEDAG